MKEEGYCCAHSLIMTLKCDHVYKALTTTLNDRSSTNASALSFLHLSRYPGTKNAVGHFPLGSMTVTTETISWVIFPKPAGHVYYLYAVKTTWNHGGSLSIALGLSSFQKAKWSWSLYSLNHKGGNSSSHLCHFAEFCCDRPATIFPPLEGFKASAQTACGSFYWKAHCSFARLLWRWRGWEGRRGFIIYPKPLINHWPELVHKERLASLQL